MYLFAFVSSKLLHEICTYRLDYVLWTKQLVYKLKDDVNKIRVRTVINSHEV
jgi:hypothetical protein